MNAYPDTIDLVNKKLNNSVDGLL